jgi:MYXO-CTERM domain-containing protein
MVVCGKIGYFEVRVIDLNGNISEPTLLHIGGHEDSGCSTTAQRSDWLLLLVLGFVLRRRRRC